MVSNFAIGADFGRRLQAEERGRRMSKEPFRLRRIVSRYWRWQKCQGTNAGAVARKIEWFIVRPLRRGA